MCFNNNESENEVETERQAFGSSEEDEFRVENTAGNANNLIEISQQPQQPLAPVVKWERYLPVRSLKVLLVENDDSTRHIVTALLKNCSYEVIAVSDVLEALKQGRRRRKPVFDVRLEKFDAVSKVRTFTSLGNRKSLWRKSMSCCL